eukprot:gene37260-8988_t
MPPLAVPIVLGAAAAVELNGAVASQASPDPHASGHGYVTPRPEPPQQ